MLTAVIVILVVVFNKDKSSTSVPMGAIATVGGQPIPRVDYDLIFSEAQGSAKAQGAKFPAAGSTDYRDLQARIVTYLIESKEAELAAKSDFGIVVSALDVEQSVDKLTKSLGGPAGLDKQLAKQGITHAQLRFTVRYQLLQKKIIDRLGEDMKISPDEAQAYYKKNISSYIVPASRKLSHILVKTEALSKAISAQLASGADFATLAKKYSIDKKTGPKGGDLGPISKGQTVASFEKAAFALKTGEISVPVKSSYGWHIIRADSAVTPAYTKPYSKVKTEIGNLIVAERQKKAVQKWIDGVQSKYGKTIHYATGFAPATTTTTS